MIIYKQLRNVLKLLHGSQRGPEVHLVCGGRRCGTTLLAAVLSSDPRANPLGQEAQLLTRLVESYQWGRNNFDHFGKSFFTTPSGYQSFYQQTVNNFIAKIAEHASPGGVLILKNPEFSSIIQHLAELIPQAKLYAILRDPRDQVASELQVAARRLSEQGKDTNSQERNILYLAEHYRSHYNPILTFYRTHPERITLIRYEDLALNPAHFLIQLQLFSALDITVDPGRQWRRVDKFASLDKTPSRSDLYGKAVCSQSVARYKQDLSPQEVSIIEEICHDFMTEFQYAI